MRAHTDEEIITKALAEKKTGNSVDDKIDVAVDLDDEYGTSHTYVVTFAKAQGSWKPLEVSELSSL